MKCKYCESKNVKERFGCYVCDDCKQATRIGFVRLLDDEGAAEIRRTLGFK
jgi:hypothetical protein